jgi:hypothetical protein
MDNFGRLYFDLDEDGILVDSNLMVSGFTEYKHCSQLQQQHVLYCAHPNHQNAGQIYDWVIIPNPNDNVDMRFGIEDTTSTKKKG